MVLLLYPTNIADRDNRVHTCTSLLPDNKPRYVMGVGYPEDLVVSIALGADMFDCVWPTRTARFGYALTPQGTINLSSRPYLNDFGPVSDTCACPVCTPKSKGGLGITRAYINHLASKETVGAHLLTMHNVYFQLDLMKRAREAILEDKFVEFVKSFLLEYCRGKVPAWATEALREVGITFD